MDDEVSIEGLAQLPLLQTVQAELDCFAERQGWTEEARFQVSLALEEVLMNVISHGAAGGAESPRVRVRLRQEEAQVSLDIADDGIAFDPLQAPPPDLDADLDQRPVGGLGVFLVRQLMDEVRYRREAGWNHLELRKRTA